MAGLRFVYKETKETVGGDYASDQIAFAKNASSLTFYLIQLPKQFLKLPYDMPIERQKRIPIYWSVDVE